MAKTSLEMLAEVPQIKKRMFWRLRDSRKSKRERFGVCGSSANQKKNVLALAGLPQIKKRTFWRLRKFRKSKRERFGACGSSANQKENALAFAEVPQIKKRTLWRLRDSRKSKKNVLALAEVPQAFPKTLWPLQRSIQAILQGLRASFFRSSSRCKDFWKGKSAAEGIRFAPIDRWEAIRSCDLYPKCRSDPATHFRPRWTGHRIANGFSPFQTAPTFAALKT